MVHLVTVGPFARARRRSRSHLTRGGHPRAVRLHAERCTMNLDGTRLQANSFGQYCRTISKLHEIRLRIGRGVGGDVMSALGLVNISNVSTTRASIAASTPAPSFAPAISWSAKPVIDDAARDLSCFENSIAIADTHQARRDNAPAGEHGTTAIIERDSGRQILTARAGDVPVTPPQSNVGASDRCARCTPRSTWPRHHSERATVPRTRHR